MDRRKKQTSWRNKILGVLKDHPEGLSSAMIRKLVSIEQAINEATFPNILMQLVNEGRIRNEGKCECNKCASRPVLYKISATQAA